MDMDPISIATPTLIQSPNPSTISNRNSYGQSPQQNPSLLNSIPLASTLPLSSSSLSTSLSTPFSSQFSSQQIGGSPLVMVDLGPIPQKEIPYSVFQIFKSELIQYYAKHHGHLTPQQTYMEHKFPQTFKAKKALLLQQEEEKKHIQSIKNTPEYKKQQQEKEMFANSRLYSIGKMAALNFTPLTLQRNVPTRFVQNLDFIKHLCKVVYPRMRSYSVDNLRTNHKGTYVLIEKRYIPTFERAFLCGIIRGSLYCISQSEAKVTCKHSVDNYNSTEETLFEVVLDGLEE